jgi:hypothetical protein
MTVERIAEGRYRVQVGGWCPEHGHYSVGCQRCPECGLGGWGDPGDELGPDTAGMLVVEVPLSGGVVPL